MEDRPRGGGSTPSSGEVLLPEAAHECRLVEASEVDARGLLPAPTSAGPGSAIDFGLIERQAQMRASLQRFLEEAPLAWAIPR